MTFLVVPDFVENARLLSMTHLVKQRIEARQILDALTKGTGWKHHPITRSWAGFETALMYYTNCVILEFIRRGGDNNLPLFDLPPVIMVPWWTKWHRLHQSHRAMLIRKDPFHYQKQFIVEPEYLPYGYIWPANIRLDQRNDHLSNITAPVPPELINPVYCPSVIKSGRRQGQPCNRLVKDGSGFCGTHRPK